MKKVLSVIIFRKDSFSPIKMQRIEDMLYDFKKSKTIGIRTIDSHFMPYQNFIDLISIINNEVNYNDAQGHEKTKILAITGSIISISSVRAKFANNVAEELKSEFKNLLWAVVDNEKQCSDQGIDDFEISKDINLGCVEAIKKIWEKF